MISIIVTKERVISFLSLIALFAIIVIYFFTYLSPESFYTKYEIKNTDRERRNFIESFGHSLKKDKVKKEKFTVPYEFSPEFSSFEKLQNEMGLSFNDFKGKTLSKYTYLTENENCYIEIYMYKNIVVACAVINPDFENGYIKSLIEA